MKIKEIVKDNKRVIAGVCIISGLLLIGKITYAEELEKALEAYLKDPSWDWLGRGYDKILFKEINEASEYALFGDEEFLAKLKFTIDDIKTMPLQAKCMWKTLNQPSNLITYVPLAGFAGLKKAMGAEKFAKMMLRLFKVVARGF